MKIPAKESYLKRKLKEFLATRKDTIYAFWPVQMGMGARTLDVLLTVHGRFVAIELKTTGNKMTAPQRNVAESIRQTGGVVLLVDDKHTLAACLQWLEVEASGGDTTQPPDALVATPLPPSPTLDGAGSSTQETKDI